MANVLRLALCAGLLSLAACAQLPTQTDPGRSIPRDAIQNFWLGARLAITRGGERLSVAIEWQHAPSSDALELNTSLGQTLARLVSGPSGARLETADHQVIEADTLETLSERALGTPLPLHALPHWVLGRAADSDAYGTRDDQGRWQELFQSGWRVVFAQYEGDTPNALPRLIDLERENVKIRVKMDQWKITP